MSVETLEEFVEVLRRAGEEFKHGMSPMAAREFHMKATKAAQEAWSHGVLGDLVPHVDYRIGMTVDPVGQVWPSLLQSKKVKADPVKHQKFLNLVAALRVAAENAQEQKGLPIHDVIDSTPGVVVTDREEPE